MTTDIFRQVKEYLGWCPNATYRRTRTAPVHEPDMVITTPAPAIPETPAPVITAPAEQKRGCPENYLLLLLLVVELFSLVDLKLLVLVGIISALAVYYDAIMIHAGEKFEKESFLGEVATWRPLTWAVWVLIFALIFLAIYVFSRDEIYRANT